MKMYYSVYTLFCIILSTVVMLKLIEAAIHGRQWNKAVQIIQHQDTAVAAPFFKQIADHYKSVKNYEVSISMCRISIKIDLCNLQLAKSFYLNAGLAEDAVHMYISADQWEPAYQIAVECMEEEEVTKLYVSHAQHLVDQGRLREAERLFVLVGQADLAISMYKKNKQV